MLRSSLASFTLAPPQLPENFNSEDAKKWLTWCDSTLAVRIYPLLTDGFGNSLKAFSYLDSVETFTPMERTTAKYIGSLAMWAAGGKIKKKYGIVDCEESLKEAVAEWGDEGLNTKAFNGGQSPNVADLGVYGVLRGLEDTGGAWFDEIVMGKESVKGWYGRMKEEVGSLEP